MMDGDSLAFAVVVKSTFFHVQVAQGASVRMARRAASQPPGWSWGCSFVAGEVARPVYTLDKDALGTWRRFDVGGGGPAAAAMRPKPAALAPPRHARCATTDAGPDEVPSSPESAKAASLEDTRTTTMMRNVPSGLSRPRLLALLYEEGFRGEIDFLYLPVDFVIGATSGYAFVNLASPAAARRFRAHFHRFSRWGGRSRLVCNVSWAKDGQQGLRANVERYRNSAVMHPSVAEEQRPILLSAGTVMPFPRPTRRIWPPTSTRRRGHPAGPLTRASAPGDGTGRATPARESSGMQTNV